MHKFGFDGLCELTEKLIRDKTPVYLTVDLDCLGPVRVLRNGNSRAGLVLELLDAVLTVSRTDMVGTDVNELAPMIDLSGASTALACKTVREMLWRFINKEFEIKIKNKENEDMSRVLVIGCGGVANVAIKMLSGR